MLARLVTCDVVLDGGARMPSCAAAGLPCASVIGDGGPLDPGWCLTLVMADDLLPLDACPEAMKLFWVDDLDRAALFEMLEYSPVELDWTKGQVDWLHDRLLERSGDPRMIGRGLKLWDHVAVLLELLGASEADLRLLLAG